MSNSLNTISVSYNSRQVDFEFDPIRNHLQGLSDKLNMLEKIAQRIHKERKGCSILTENYKVKTK